MAERQGKFTVSYTDLDLPTQVFATDGIFIGRLRTNDVVLDDPSVSRVHAAINFQDDRYVVANISSSNVMTLNGRRLAPQKDDVLADGDTVQIGHFILLIARIDDELLFVVERQQVEVSSSTPSRPAQPAAKDRGGVLDVFWEKRTREKEDVGTRLRPTERPLPGKAMINWKPTGDLRRPWRNALFIWAFLLVGAIAVAAFYKYPETYAPKPLAGVHSMNVDQSTIAAASNGNSCTTCHTPDQPVENACISCHTAEKFHPTNTRAHEEAGVTCTTCHVEHRGEQAQLVNDAIASCAECHNDSNQKTYNERSVKTAHGGAYGYPVEGGAWKWRGVYREVAEMIPEINSPATGDKDDQARISRHFHSIHVARLVAPEGMAADKFGLVSCSTCHKSFTPIDRVTPKQTCAACHTAGESTQVKDERFAAGGVNCISCHVQHAYNASRWSEFLSDESLKRRNDAVAGTIKRLGEK